MTDSATLGQISKFPCEQCGASLQYQPGTTSLKCPYCGHTTAIAAPTEEVRELCLDQFFDVGKLQLELETETVVHCHGCAAEYSVPANESSAQCPFCGSTAVVRTEPEHRIAPNGVLPFHRVETQARNDLRNWLGSRFWAPNDLKKMALNEGRLRAMYVPYWTYDSDTLTHYTGSRGVHYYVTETYTDGQGRTQTRQVRRTHWYPAAGTVSVDFDDVLVVASNAIPTRYAQNLRTWDLHRVVAYERSYTVGFQTMRYDIDLQEGWDRARMLMEPDIDRAIRSDIGGDEQRIFSKDTSYDNNTFKQLLLPVYAGSYRYRQKSYRVLINGRTGEVQGEAPISVWKVLIAVLLGLLVVGAIVYFANTHSSATGSSGGTSADVAPGFSPDTFSPDSLPSLR